MRRSRSVFWSGIATLTLSFGLIAIGSTCLIGGCASNPVAAAKTPDQTAYAIYGEFVIFEEQAATVVGDNTVDIHVRQAIQAADAKAKPSADALLRAYTDYATAQRLLAQAQGSAGAVTVASANLEQWIATAQVDVEALVAAVKAR